MRYNFVSVCVRRPALRLLVRRFLRMKRENIVLYCSNGYLFDEAYLPLIDDKYPEWDITLVLGNYYFTKINFQTIEKLQQEGKVKDCFFLPLAEIRKFQFHKEMSALCRRLDQIPVSILVTGDDYTISSIYLIHAVGRQKAKTVVLNLSTIWPVLRDFSQYKEKTKNFNESSRKDIAKKIQNLYKLSKSPTLFLVQLINKIRVRLGTLAYGTIKRLERKLDYIIYPLIYNQSLFVERKLDRQRKPADCADYNIVFDLDEQKALEDILTKPVLLAKHPSEDLVKCSAERSRRLLVIFNGCLRAEMGESDQHEWLRVIFQIAELAEIKEVHLRLHPRSDNRLQWPVSLCEAIQKKGLSALIVNNAISLPTVICGYLGILGGPSNALRVARALRKNIFILGLSNRTDHGPDDQEWILGKGEGIRWLRPRESVMCEHLNPISDCQKSIPSTRDVIQNILYKEKS